MKTHGNTGKKHTAEAKAKISLHMKGVKNRLGVIGSEKQKLVVSAIMSGSGNPNWKGDNVSYSALHHWINSKLPKSKECVYCGNDSDLEWASISHNAKRDLDDYIPLCVKCHRNYDNKRGGGILWQQ